MDLLTKFISAFQKLSAGEPAKPAANRDERRGMKPQTEREAPVAPAAAPEKPAQRPVNALIEATRNGDFAAVKELLDKGADINAADASGKTSLIYAARDGRTEIARLLIDRGADVLKKNNGGETALIYAGRKGHGEITRMLLARGANIDDRG